MTSLREKLASSRRFKLFDSLGIANYCHFLVQIWRLQRRSDKNALHLRSRWANYPLLCRANTTDILVFDQIFVEREYQSLDHLKHPEVIVDCGANVGYSSAYFLSRFPKARLLAIEPDNDNFEVLALNLAPFGNRAQAMKAAVWSHCAQLTLDESTFRDGAEWSRQVRECRPGERGFGAIDIGTLLEENHIARVSLLKMDIEGAEAVVFSCNFQSWIDRIDNIAIELHDDSPFGDARGAFRSAIEGRGFRIYQAGELTICQRQK